MRYGPNMSCVISYPAIPERKVVWEKKTPPASGASCASSVQKYPGGLGAGPQERPLRQTPGCIDASCAALRGRDRSETGHTARPLHSAPCLHLGIAILAIGGQTIGHGDDPIRNLAEFRFAKAAGRARRCAKTDAAGDHRAFGVERDAVLVAGDMRAPRAFSVALPFTPLGRRSTSSRCVSVPPVTVASRLVPTGPPWLVRWR